MTCARAALSLLVSLALFACGGGGSGGDGGTGPGAERRTGTVGILSGPSAPPDAPVIVSLEGNDGSADVAWREDVSATQSTLFVRDLDDAGAAVRQLAGVQSPYRFTGLVNGHRYEVYLSSSNAAGSSPDGAPQTVEPGTVPDAPTMMVAVPQGGMADVYWSPVADATAYRVYYANKRKQLADVRRPVTNYAEVAPGVTSVRLPIAKFYRVQALNGPRVDEPDMVAYAPTYSIVYNNNLYLRLRGDLQDWNGDDCPDLVTALGDCTGHFEALDLAAVGLDGLYANGRINGDTRIVDFDNDGDFDFITNVYVPATDANSNAIYHVNDGTGHFTQDAAFDALSIGGFGETLVAADFDNDGAVDLFMPHYWHRGEGGRNWLMVHEGGQLVDRAAEAGVLAGPLPPIEPYRYIPEGAQSFDFDGDGWLDLYVASELYLNDGDGTFTARGAEHHAPFKFDEGLEFADIDLDGDLDLVLNDITYLRVYRNVDGVFDDGEIIGGDGNTQSYGLNVCDLNADGYPDIVWASVYLSSYLGTPKLYINAMGQMREANVGIAYLRNHDIIGCTDIDRNGVEDFTVNGAGITSFIANSGALPHLRVRVLDASGRRTQYGRTVRIRSVTHPEVTFTRTVDGGAGYHTQSDYDIVVPTPWPGRYQVTVVYASGSRSIKAVAGQLATFREGNAPVTLTPIADLR